MNSFKLTNGSKLWEFQIEQMKYIIDTSNEWFSMVQALRQFNIKDKSEYREEYDLKAQIFIDENVLNMRNSIFFEISDSYSVIEDRKLNGKSLMLKYLELKLQNQECFESISTIDILLSALAEEINESSIVKVLFDSTGVKQLLKMLTSFYEDELQMDEYDLSFNDLFRLQIQMIRYIAENQSKYDHIIVYLKLNVLNQNLLAELQSLKDCKILIFTNQYNSLMNLKDICLIQKELIDFADEEYFYHQFTRYSFDYYTIEEVQMMIQKYLKENYTQKYTDIYQELEHFYKD